MRRTGVDRVEKCQNSEGKREPLKIEHLKFNIEHLKLECSMPNFKCSITAINEHNMSKIYQLKITLKRISPPIWRRIEVPSDTRLDDLSRVILRAMGWYGYHLMSFEHNREIYYGDRESELELEGRLMAKYTLNKLLRAPKDKLLFNYDFGDDWRHDVTLEKILDPEPGTKYPRCTAGKRNCPPEHFIWPA